MTNGRLSTGWLILLLASVSVAATPFYHPSLLIAQRDYTENAGISLDQAVEQARQHKSDKVLSADTIRVDGRKVYRIKILTKDGRVKRIRIDARSGQELSRGD
jgi:uncharacterized membrane protein YkoI